MTDTTKTPPPDPRGSRSREAAEAINNRWYDNVLFEDSLRMLTALIYSHVEEPLLVEIGNYGSVVTNEAYIKEINRADAAEASLVEARRELETCRIALREIGEVAVVDWQDKLVGIVDAALKNDRDGVEYWAIGKRLLKTAQAENARLREGLEKLLHNKAIHRYDNCPCFICKVRALLHPPSAEKESKS